MSTLSVVAVLEDGLERLTEPLTAVLYGSLFLAHLAVTVGAQSQLAAQRDRLEGGAFPAVFDLSSRELPLSIGVSLGVATILWLAGFVSVVALSIVALRAFVTADPTGDESGPVPERTDAPRDGSAAGPASRVPPNGSTARQPTGARRGLEFGGLASATARGVAALLLSSIAVGIGLALVLPGLYLAAALAFALPYVATAGSGPIESLRSSWRLTSGHRFRVFGVLVVAWVGYVGVGVMGSVAGAVLDGAGGDVLVVAVDAAAWLFVLAVLAGAFDRLEGIRAAEADRWADVDEELLP